VSQYAQGQNVAVGQDSVSFSDGWAMTSGVLGASSAGNLGTCCAWVFGVAMIGWLLYAFLSALFGRGSGSAPAVPPPPGATTRGPAHVHRPNPNAGSSRRKIRFSDADSPRRAGLADGDLADLVDAVTGAPIRPEPGLRQCQRCKVLFQEESYRFLVAQNRGQCASCGDTGLTIYGGAKVQERRNAAASLVPLSKVRDMVRQTVLFEGRVVKVLTSKRGTDHAVMFEDTTWSKGFKMVAFQGNVDAIGGAAFLRSLAGRTVRVRGLVTYDPRFGYSIVVTQRSMILGIS
jgi:hypothetical protein